MIKNNILKKKIAELKLSEARLKFSETIVKPLDLQEVVEGYRARWRLEYYGDFVKTTLIDIK